MTLSSPFWVKHKKGQEEKVFLVPFVYMGQPASHTRALLCTQDELAQLQKVHGVPLSEIGGVLPGHVRLVVWRKRRHSLPGWKPFG